MSPKNKRLETESFSENKESHGLGDHPNSRANLKPFKKGQSGNPGGYPILNYTQTYQLSANDVIGFRVQTGGLYANNGNNYNAQFMGHLIG